MGNSKRELSLARWYKQEKELSKNIPIFSSIKERSEFIQSEIDRETDQKIKDLLFESKSVC